MENYNGWTNYNTWKVNLELVDSDFYAEYLEDYGYDAYQLAEAIEQDATEQALFGIDCNNLFAVAAVEDFLQQVNWHEIAKSINH